MSRIDTSRASVCEGMVLAMELITNSAAVVDSIWDAIRKSQDFDKLKALMFLVNDILFNSVKVTNAWTYKKDFESRLPDVMVALNRVPEIVKPTRKLVRLWQDKSIFESRFVAGLEATLTLKPAESYAF
jgi:CID domain